MPSRLDPEGHEVPTLVAALHDTMAHAVYRLNEEKERTACLEPAAAGLTGHCKMMVAQRRVALDFLLAGWGLGTWLGVNGLYVQLPLLVERLPEGWGLPASMNLAIQLANVGLVIYALLRRFLPRVSDAPYIYSLLVLGTLSLAINAFVYQETVTIAGSERSFAFLALAFAVALVGCSSSVIFYPYMRHFRDLYLATYLVGEGLSGFLPSLIALAQGVGGEPECLPADDGSHLVPHYPPARFNSTVFMLLLSALAAVSLFSFTAIDNMKTFLSERVDSALASKEEDSAVAVAGAGVGEGQGREAAMTSPRWLGVLVMMACLNALMNGVMPSVQSYSCMPYGTSTYHLAVTLGAMANPVACLAGVWLKAAPARWLGAALALNLLPLGYILATALTSPAPPLVGLTSGSTLVVLAWVVCTAIISYSRMWIYGWARQGGAKGMRVCGAVGQVGSALGSLLLYLLVNHTGIFVQPDTCPAIAL